MTDSSRLSRSLAGRYTVAQAGAKVRENRDLVPGRKLLFHADLDVVKQ